MKRHWKDSFCSMDPRVDQDHRTLFKLLDQVATHRRDSDVEDLNPLLDQLLEYTFDHFAREEKAMATWGYPQQAHHSTEHLAMRKSFIESLRQVVKGGMAIPVFIQHVKESFTYHFETEDMLFVCWQQQTDREGKRTDSARVGG
jgi:hemerythrin-like metal-binding protein